MAAKEIQIRGDYITLGQFLKFAGIAGDGAEARRMLIERLVLVNGIEESRRGMKLRRGDRVKLRDGGEFLIIG